MTSVILNLFIVGFDAMVWVLASAGCIFQHVSSCYYASHPDRWLSDVVIGFLTDKPEYLEWVVTYKAVIVIFLLFLVAAMIEVYKEKKREHED
jgi:hypothetical protein